jgi:hypothetical protein
MQNDKDLDTRRGVASGAQDQGRRAPMHQLEVM